MAVDTSALVQAIEEMLQNGGDQATQETLDDLQALAPVETGELQDSGHATSLGGGQGRYSWEIAFPVPQAEWTDAGTKPHEISGNPYLAFQVGGSTVIVRRVNHPGNRGTGWFSDNAARLWEEKLDPALQDNTP